MDSDSFAEHPKSQDQNSIWRSFLTNKDRNRGKCVKCKRVIKAEGKSNSNLNWKNSALLLTNGRLYETGDSLTLILIQKTKLGTLDLEELLENYLQKRFVFRLFNVQLLDCFILSDRDTYRRSTGKISSESRFRYCKSDNRCYEKCR